MRKNSIAPRSPSTLCFFDLMNRWYNMVLTMSRNCALYSQKLCKVGQAVGPIYFLKGDGAHNMRDTCKSLHLAFKDQSTTDEVYDVLVLIFLRVCAHYDPLYPKKTEKVCKFLESKPDNAVLTVEDIASAVGFDPTGCIRILVKRGHLASVQGSKKSTLGYRRGPIWPASTKLFQITSMGFTGFAQRFFRWYLRNYIVERMGELENSGLVLQLDHKAEIGQILRCHHNQPNHAALVPMNS